MSKELMQKIVDMFATGNTLDASSVVSEDYIAHQGLRGIEIRGWQGFTQVVNAARNGIRELKVNVEEIIAEDDKVAVKLKWEGCRTLGCKSFA